MPITRTTIDPSEVGQVCLKWNEVRYPICWSDNPYTWNDVCLIFELINGGGTDEEVFERYEQWEEEKKKKFITLYCKVKEQNGDIYKDVGKETKEVNDRIFITAKEIRMVVEAVLKPTVNVITETKDV